MDYKYHIKLIYALVCPVDGKIKYIGATYNPPQRLRQHIFSPAKNLKGWIDSLRSKGLTPSMTLLETKVNSNPYEREKYWIKYYSETQGGLLNEWWVTKHKP